MFNLANSSNTWWFELECVVSSVVGASWVLDDSVVASSVLLSSLGNWFELFSFELSMSFLALSISFLILSNLSTIEVSDLEEVGWFEGSSVVGASFDDSSVVDSSFVTSSVVFSEVFDSEDEDSFDVVASFCWPLSTLLDRASKSDTMLSKSFDILDVSSAEVSWLVVAFSSVDASWVLDDSVLLSLFETSVVFSCAVALFSFFASLIIFLISVWFLALSISSL